MIEAKVFYLNAPFELRVKTERIDAGVGEKHVVCETLATVISPGTELAAYQGLPPLRPGKTYPRVLGYCNVARVLQCGSAVSAVVAGDRVLSFASHRSHFVVSEDRILALLPDSITNRAGASAYLYHLGYDAILKGHVKYGMPMVVLGLGAIGLATVAVAANAGATVHAVSNQRYLRDLSRQFGACAAYDRDQLHRLKSALDERLADLVITTSSDWTDWQHALALAGRNGQINVLGFPGRGSGEVVDNPLASRYFYDKQLTIKAVGMSPEQDDSRHNLRYNEKANLRFLLDEIAAGALTPDALISDELSWDRLDEAYQALLSRQREHVTFSLHWCS